MRFDSFVNVLVRRRGGAWVLGRLAAVLAGVERLLAVTKATACTNQEVKPKPRQAAPESGREASFELFDTWADAMAAANVRLSACLTVA